MMIYRTKFIGGSSHSGLTNDNYSYLNEKTARTVNIPVPGEQPPDSDCMIANAPSQANDVMWLIKPINMKLIRPTWSSY